MSAHRLAQIQPMKTAGTHHLIERTYRESGQFQWVRESLVNAIEAGATRIEFGMEWQAVESLGVYRRTIADNGSGMTAEQLVEFFNTFGGGGKPIGGAHENFGVGVKTSLLPWNRYGVAVISWVDGRASMIWVMQDEVTQEYGLKVERIESESGEIELDAVYEPYLDERNGCDWAQVKPDWIKEHGTVIVLLGNNPTDDTVEGDPSRDEKDIKGVSKYLNRRFWEFEDSVEVYVDELRTNDRVNWPPSEKIGHGPPDPNRDRRTNHRDIRGAKHHIEWKVARFDKGKLASNDSVELKDGTVIDWYLWEGERPVVHTHASKNGYVAALYKDELYDISFHHATFRLFGVSDNSVRQRLWLIIRPVVDPTGKRGVYPKTDRNSLLLRGGPSAGGPLPIGEWASEFADNMPDDIVAALKEARHGGSGEFTDNEWRERLADKFGSRWKVPRLRLKVDGIVRLTEVEEGLELMPQIRKRPQTPRPPDSVPRIPHNHNGAQVKRHAKMGGELQAEWAKARGGVPRYRRVGSAEVGEGMIAAWQPYDPEYPEGVVLLNVDHPVLRQVIEHWQSQYADHHAESIEKDVIDVYGQVAVSKVAHSEHLKTILPKNIIEQDLRSESALTMALLGLMAEDHLISTRIGGKYSKRRSSIPNKNRASPATTTPN